MLVIKGVGREEENKMVKYLKFWNIDVKLFSSRA